MMLVSYHGANVCMGMLTFWIGELIQLQHLIRTLEVFLLLIIQHAKEDLFL